jgi:hypothetical protein
MFTWTSGHPSGQRVEWGNSNNSTYGDFCRPYFSSPPRAEGGEFIPPPQGSKNGEGGAVWVQNEIRRHLFRLKNGTIMKTQPDNGDLRETPNIVGQITTITGLAAPTRIGFGCRAYHPTTADSPLTNATLRCVTVWNTDLTDQHMNALGRGPVILKPPVHLLGDSFLNNYDVFSTLKVLAVSRGYVGFSQDGVGGNTLTQHAVRYLSLNRKFRDSTLVICEMGWDGVWADTEIALKSILGGITHDRWLILEPAPNQDAGTGGRAIYDEFMSKIREFAGDRWVPTLDAAMALSDASPSDIAKVAARRWPTSLTISNTDFHPNHTLGVPFMAGQIYNALVSRSWI